MVGLMRCSLKASSVNKSYLWPLIFSIIMLLAAVLNLPYGFYTLLRFVVSGAAIYVAYCVYNFRHDTSWKFWTLGFIALLFNPFFPIHLDKEIWIFLDLFTAIVFAIIILKENARQAKFKDEAAQLNYGTNTPGNTNNSE